MRLIITIILSAITLGIHAQNRAEDTEKTTNFPKMRKMVATDIPGAPIPGQPQYLEGTKNEIRIEKHGLIYPAFFDWNGDGKKDLMLGEFETGDTGSYIKVYLNEGSDKKPEFSGEYFYATDVNGDTITNHQWCCIGIHPRLVDMDGDGHLDLLSGQYNPGLISMWRGSDKGFMPREFIPQKGYEEGKRFAQDREPWSEESWAYWNYTSADFADFNGDGLLDLFVGGSDGFRVALNIGTKEKPSFGIRKYLYHVNGDILNVDQPSQKEIEEAHKTGRYPNMSGVGKGYMTPVDWDGDGVLDLLITHEYYKEGHHPIEFFRGVNTDKGLRFEQTQPLFTEVNGEKAMPGCQPMITVVDYNNDGVNDIVMGLSIPTINGYEAVPEIAWRWTKEMGIEMPGKDAGRTIEYAGGVKGAIEKIEADAKGWTRRMYMGNLDDYKYLTMRHRGYVFVFEGKKNPEKATVKHTKALPTVENIVLTNEQSKHSQLDGPVNYSITFPERIKYRKEMELVVDFKLKKDWYLYSENKANVAAGFIPTVVAVEFESDKVEKTTEMLKPKEHPKGGMVVYKGDDVQFVQKFKLNSPTREEYMAEGFKDLDEVKVKVTIKFQTCNNDMCLPPETITENITAAISMF
ncbi:MAG: FG-GAP-like repeat-containing protein [Bacteroidales bacterium]|nr:FG-GAP-like repeat-containing protein [Bacteroidales bacterium]